MTFQWSSLIGTACLHCGAFEFECKLTLGELVSAIVTILVATWIARLAGQLTDRRKYFIEIVGRDLAHIEARVSEIEAFFEASARTPRPLLESHQVLAAFRAAMNRTEHLRKQLVLFQFHDSAQTSAAELALLLTSLKQEATRERFPVEGFTINLSQRARYERGTLAVRAELARLALGLTK